MSVVEVELPQGSSLVVGGGNINVCDGSSDSVPATNDISLPTPAREGLTRPLSLLFAINGITLALPMTSYMYIVNSRVAMPLSLLPTYAALAFLPASLKPLYAFLSNSKWLTGCGRHRLIALLLVLGGVFTMLVAWIPSGAVLLCIILAFLRGIVSAWPEFLLDITLIDQARAISCKSYEEMASLFQAQAATARNVGALFSHGLVMLWMLLMATDSTPPDTIEDGNRVRRGLGMGQLNDRIVMQLLLMTGLFYLVGALIAVRFHVGENVEGNSSTLADNRTPRSYSAVSIDEDRVEGTSQHRADTVVNSGTVVSARLVVGLQITVLILALKEPLQNSTPGKCWEFLLVCSCAGCLLTICLHVFSSDGSSSPSHSLTDKFFMWWSKPWPRSYRVGLFLMLRNAIPSISYLMSSFIYDVFGKSAPAFLTVLSVWDMAVLSMASCLYGKLLSRFSQRHENILRLIAGTTLLASLVFWFGNTLLLRLLRCPDEKESCGNLTWPLAMATMLIQSMLTLTAEWKFLPDVVLATTTATVPEGQVNGYNHANVHEDDTENTLEDDVDESEAGPTRSKREADSAAVGYRYGSLISCIDFGGQVGAIAITPLVKAFGTSRENNWEHMEDLVQMSAASMFLSIGFIVLVWRQ